MSLFNIILDILIVVVLILCALRGRHRGFVLTLCSLVALLVALVGSLLLTDLVSPTVAGWLEPLFESSVTSTVENAVPDGLSQASLSTEDLKELLAQSDLPLGLNGFLSGLADQIPEFTTQDIVSSFSKSLTSILASVVASAVVFLVFFILILLVWRLISRGLNLITKLPVLNFLNKLGGLLLGIIRGGVFVYAGLWVLRALNVLTPEIFENDVLLHFFESLMPN